MKLLSLVTLLALLLSGNAFSKELGIAELLDRAEATSPDIASNHELVTADEKAIDSARSGYLPYLHFDAIDSTGFPSSTSQLGIGGVAGSAYRSGAAGALVLNQTLWDFGRTSSAVEAAKRSADARKVETEVRRIDVDRAAAQAYFVCVRYRGQIDAWKFMLEEAKIVAQEVKKFVNTGQRSVVERYLVDAQVEEAGTMISDFKARIEYARQRIGTLTRLSAKSFECPAESEVALPSDDAIASRAALSNPRVVVATEQADASHAKADQASAERNPKLVGLATAGMMEKARLVGKQDYALGVGLVLPLYTGGKVSAEIDRANALASAKDFDAQSARDQVDLTNEKYDEAIEGMKARLRSLTHELELDEKAFALAKKRYFGLQGSLVDVREALRNLMSSKTGISEARATLLEASYAKAVFNGWRPKGGHGS